MKIKKILCSIIIGFGFISFSNAGVIISPGEYLDVGGGIHCTINSDLSFNCDNGVENVLWGKNDVNWALWWRTDGVGWTYGRGDKQRLANSFFVCNGTLNLGDNIVSSNIEDCNGFSISYSGLIDLVNGNTLKGFSNLNVYPQPLFVFDDFFFSFYINRSRCYHCTASDYNLGVSGFPSPNWSNAGVIKTPFSFSSVPTQTNQLTCPTIQQLINNFEPQYNTGLCYSSNLIYSGGQFQQVTPKTIFELYPQYQNFANDINTYYNYCKPPSTQETCGNAFTGKIEEWTLISKLPDNVTPVNVYNYCNYTLNLDPNQTICTISTGNLNPGGITIEDNIDNINRLPITVVTPGKPPQEEGNGTGSVFDKYTQQEDETKRRDIIGKAENTIETMKEIYTKLSGIFRAREGKDGIIPPLITGLIALILLFKLWKK